jgi:glycosyltransferase involved in cell wall biosynthesis
MSRVTSISRGMTGARRGAPYRISVIVPARDAAATIGGQLAALAAQRYEGSWEVIVADNGSADATATVADRWIGRIPGLRVVTALLAPGFADTVRFWAGAIRRLPRAISSRARRGAWRRGVALALGPAIRQCPLPRVVSVTRTPVSLPVAILA